MPKYVCSQCRKILVRSYLDMRFNEGRSWCDEAGDFGTLTRLKIRKRPKATHHQQKTHPKKPGRSVIPNPVKLK